MTKKKKRPNPLIAKFLLEKRLCSGVSLDYVSHSLDIDKEMLKFFEEGKLPVPIETLVRLARLYGVSSTEIELFVCELQLQLQRPALK